VATNIQRHWNIELESYEWVRNYIDIYGNVKISSMDMNTQYFMVNNHRTWGALHKAWRGYSIAKNKYEYDSIEYYATVIQKLQHELGLPVSSFPDMVLRALKSGQHSKEEHLSNDEDNKDINSGIIQEDHNYEDEYFKGDFNKEDRFTS
jgi:hypothetical protein